MGPPPTGPRPNLENSMIPPAPAPVKFSMANLIVVIVIIICFVGLVGIGIVAVIEFINQIRLR